MFRNDKYTKDGLYTSCKSCDKLYYEKNKHKVDARRVKNKERIREYKVEWDKNNTQKLSGYYKKYGSTEKCKSRRKVRASKPRSRLLSNLRTRLLDALESKVWSKNTHFSQYIGCSKETLVSHLESQFQVGMTWDNYGKGDNKWNIDHIIPLGMAVTEKELYSLCHYTNLQPLWEKDHKVKTKKDTALVKKNKTLTNIAAE
jgi:hypothetical protein